MTKQKNSDLFKINKDEYKDLIFSKYNVSTKHMISESILQFNIKTYLLPSEKLTRKQLMRYVKAVQNVEINVET
jgi:hypothetical protein